MIVIAMVVVTINRGQKIIENILLYFSGSLSYLDYIIEHPSQFASNQPLHGYLTFAAFIEPIVLLLKVLGLKQSKFPRMSLTFIARNIYNIGNRFKIYFNKCKHFSNLLFLKGFWNYRRSYRCHIYGRIISKSI